MLIAKEWQGSAMTPLFEPAYYPRLGHLDLKLDNLGNPHTSQNTIPRHFHAFHEFPIRYWENNQLEQYDLDFVHHSIEHQSVKPVRQTNRMYWFPPDRHIPIETPSEDDSTIHSAVDFPVFPSLSIVYKIP